MQTMCYWFVDLEKRGNITISFVANGEGQNCYILWWAFNYQFKSSSVFHGSLIFQDTDFRCNLYSVTTGWMLFSVCFLFGKDYEDHGTINVDVRRRKVQHYKDIVIKYGHFRLKITGVSRPILFDCVSTCVFSQPKPTVDDSTL